MSLALRVATCLLAVLLVASSFAKLAWPHDRAFLWGPFAYYGAAVTEIVLAVALGTGGAKWALLGVLALAGVGCIVAFWSRGAPCGCLGGMHLSARQHLLLSGGLGALAGAILWASGKGLGEPVREPE